MSKYIGSCHCGGVRFEIDTQDPLGPYCTQVQLLAQFPQECSNGCYAPRAALRVSRLSADLIATYTWNTGEAQGTPLLQGMRHLHTPRHAW